jgi:hypothetical protein
MDPRSNVHPAFALETFPKNMDIPGDFSWPASSPFLSSRGFLLWGCLKRRVFLDTFSSLAHSQTKNFGRKKRLITCYVRVINRVHQCIDLDGRYLTRVVFKGRFTHCMPRPCRSPAMLRQCHVLRQSPCDSRKYPNC